VVDSVGYRSYVIEGCWEVWRGDVGLLWVAWRQFQDSWITDDRGFVFFRKPLRTKLEDKNGENLETGDNQNPPR
jgi:hypothetical protein